MTINMNIFDRQILNVKRLRAIKQGAETFLFDRVEAELQERLSLIKREFKSRVNHIGEEAVSGAADLFLSNLQLQFNNNVQGLLKSIRLNLNPDGLFLASFIGGESLKELHHSFALAESELTGKVSPHIHPMIDLKTAGNLLQQAGFTLPVVDSEVITVRYSYPLKLLHDLRKMGATNSLHARNKGFMRKDILMKTLEIYQRDFAESDGKVPATFEVVYLLGWSPHESQQKPLKRGSATHSLEMAIKANPSTG